MIVVLWVAWAVLWVPFVALGLLAAVCMIRGEAELASQLSAAAWLFGLAATAVGGLAVIAGG